jgi:hypothetical protein
MKLAKGESCASISKEFALHISTISNINVGKRWSHIKI